MELLKKVEPWWRGRYWSRSASEKVSCPLVLQVAQQLQRWVTQRTLIWIKPSFDGVFYQSLVLDVDAEQRIFRIDALFPFNLPQTVLMGQTLEFEVRDRRQCVCFKARCNDVEISNDEFSLWVQMPPRIEQRQRRGAFRVDLSRIRDAVGRLVHVDDQVVLGEFPIANISASGVALLVPELSAKQLTTSQRTALTISVMDVMFDVVALVRRVAPEVKGYCVVGLEFVDLSPLQVQKLAKWTVKLQRQLKQNFVLV